MRSTGTTFSESRSVPACVDEEGLVHSHLGDADPSAELTQREPLDTPLHGHDGTLRRERRVQARKGHQVDTYEGQGNVGRRACRW